MSLLRSLSGRLLLLTILFVMLAEVLIFVPSVARFREAYLQERILRANIAALNVMARGDDAISPGFAEQLLRNAEVLNIVVREEGRRELILSVDEMVEVTETYDLRDADVFTLIGDALAAMFESEPQVIRVIGQPDGMAKALEITLDTGPLVTEMRAYGLRILRLSLVISVMTAGLVFLTFRRFVVSPIAGVIESMMRFSDDPGRADAVIRPRSRVGEVAEAERALAAMQTELRRALHQRARLAALGEAVAKISHDLRNILASTQLLADRLERSSDPIVTRVAPKLLSSLDRAIRLCQSSLDFGKAEEAPPVIRQVDLASLAADVAEGLGLDGEVTPVRAVLEVPPGMTVPADPEQLYRVLANLMRNAKEAISATGRSGTVTVRAGIGNGVAEIDIEDDGPGMPAAAMEHIFEPFRGGARRGGTGLGLAIAHELVEAVGGRLELIASTTAGTRFRITLPTAASGRGSGKT